ncbi:MAG: nucleotide sugar dehydrogenase, partial [Sediminibacterium sp.]|nr:nucleotide sugar dehydrogenase [Sediminibacterium sp.]
MKSYSICIIGLGYVGLPLAIEFGKKYKTVGFDINELRLQELKKSIDSTLEIQKQDFKLSSKLSFTNKMEDAKNCNFFIVTVPTPVDNANNPDFNALINASKSIASVLKKGDIVVFESTVFPGATEEICVPIIEANCNLVFNKDFFVGYSPERINPGDKERTLTKIKKIISGSNPKTTNTIHKLYSSIIKAGIYKTSSIKVAEAAKAIENAQRDINIAFVNELAKIFNLIGIDTNEVLDAACTKWNFLNFRPGLVGGHCIGVDPYYLTKKANELGYYPEIILAGRRLNDSMGPYIAQEVIKAMILKKIHILNSNILIMGFTFKENCPDIRNTKVIDIVKTLNEYKVNVHIFDPLASESHTKNEYNITLTNDIKQFNHLKFDA